MKIAEEMRLKALENKILLKQYESILDNIYLAANKGELYIHVNDLTKSMEILLESNGFTIERVSSNKSWAIIKW
jgi:hypothetical protein